MRSVAIVITDGFVYGMKPVNADTNETVDGGRAVQNISSDPSFAQGDSHPPGVRVH